MTTSTKVMTLTTLTPLTTSNYRILPAQLTSLALIQFSAETFFYKIMQAVAKRLELYAVDNLIDEGKLQEKLCLLQTDTALTHVEQSRVVELTYGAAVGTLHVVGINLQHRLGVHTRLLGGTEILVCLLRNGLLSAVTHKHTTCEGSRCAVVEHIFIKFVARAVSHAVVYQRVVVNVLFLVGYNASAEITLGTLTCKHKVSAVACYSVVQRYYVMVNPAAALLLNKQVAHAHILCVSLLKTVKVKSGIVADISLNNLGCKEITVVGSMVAEEQLDFSPLLYYYQHTTLTIRSTSERRILITCTALLTTTPLGT